MSDHRMEREQHLANFWFERLIPLLAATPLPCEHGPARICGVDEFMFMGERDDGLALFKHRDTRNYVHLRAVNDKYELTVPKGGAFALGFFDSFEIPDTK